MEPIHKKAKARFINIYYILFTNHSDCKKSIEINSCGQTSDDISPTNLSQTSQNAKSAFNQWTTKILSNCVTVSTHIAGSVSAAMWIQTSRATMSSSASVKSAILNSTRIASSTRIYPNQQKKNAKKSRDFTLCQKTPH